MGNKSSSQNSSAARVLPFGFSHGIGQYDFQNKGRNVQQIASYYLCKTQSMFEYDNLPDTIKARVLELYLQVNGHCAFLEYNGNYYTIQGGFAGELDYNYMPKQYTTVNPYLPGLPCLHTIGENCVVIGNDSLYVGLSPMLSKFAMEMTETDLSMIMTLINSRLAFILSAPDDNTAKSAKAFLDSIVKGELGVIRDNVFTGNIGITPSSKQGAYSLLQELDEHRQYLRGMFYHDLGLDSAFNMKRERLNTSETELNKDTLFPFVDDMLKARQNAITEINAKWGLNITVRFSSSWEDEQMEREIELEQMETIPKDSADLSESGVTDNV